MEMRIGSLNRTQGFPQLSAQIRGGPVQPVEHVFLSTRAHLLPSYYIAAPAVYCRQIDYVFAPETGDRSADHCFAASPQANLAGKLGAESLIGLTVHQPQRVGNPLIRQGTHLGGFGKIDRQSLLERVVESLVAGAVVEIGENDGLVLR